MIVSSKKHLKNKTLIRYGWVLMTSEKVLKRHKLIIIVMRRRKHFFLTLYSWIDALRVESKKITLKT